MPEAFARACLDEWLPGFLDAYPDLRMEIEASERVVDIAAEGFDVVVHAGILDDSGFVARKLSTSRRIAVASPKYLARSGTPRPPQEVRDHVLIDFSRRRISGTWEFLDGDGKRVAVRVAPKVVCNNADTEKTLAVAGLGITRLPEFSCVTEIAAGSLTPILEAYEEEPIGLYAIYPSRQQLASKVRVFVDFLAAQFISESNGKI